MYINTLNKKRLQLLKPRQKTINAKDYQCMIVFGNGELQVTKISASKTR